MSNANVSITIVGSSNTDLVVRVPHIPLPGETLLGGDVERIPGGKGANQAVAARRLGTEVWFVGCLGDDSFGDAAAAHLADEGLRLAHLARVAGQPSGVALIAVAASGENSIIVAPGANAALTPAHIDAATPAIAASHMLVAQLEVPLPTVQHAFAVAHAHGCHTLLNAAPAQALPDTLMALVDVLVCNETEAEALTALAVTDVASATQAAQALHARGAGEVIITLGGNGCLVVQGATAQHLPAYPVTVVDTTAAGDAFVGALATRLALGDDLVASARFASACGALTVTRAGAQPSLPTAEQVRAFLADQP